MAKGAPPYFDPSAPISGPEGKNVFTRFWTYFLEQLNVQANALIDLATDVTGILQIINGGTAASTANQGFANLSPMSARGDLITRNATVPVRLPIGTVNQVLTSNGTDPMWAALGGAGGVTTAVTLTNDAIVLGAGTTTIKVAAGTGAVYATAGIISYVTPSGTWTPTLTNTTNLDGSAAFLSQWSRAGDVVTFAGRVDLDPTAGATSTVLGMSLPIASNFGNNFEAGGTFANPAVASECGAILADAVNKRLTFQFVAISTTTQSFFFSGSYLVVP